MDFIKGTNLTQEKKLFNSHMNVILQAFLEHRISAFVGTGFSKNATAIDPNITIPLWPEVGAALMKELGIKVVKNKTNFQDPIRLSSLYAAEFGDTKLDDFLKKSIDDNNFQPNEVHEKFVELNWNNIYTTNYDTLLEKAANQIDKQYSVITGDADFPILPTPRIVKLHGSFPNTRPFIMTDEQFRTYPSEHPIFVNSVQQTLIEDTVVLFGFSGNDPNFLKWSGWIRDNLKSDNAKKIYLISIYSVSSAELKMFDKQNITVLDMSVILDPNKKNNITSDDIKKLFIQMFDYWNTYSKIPTISNQLNTNPIENWIKTLWKPKKTVEEELKKQGYDKFIKAVTTTWNKERNSYPKQLVLPLNQNNQLFWKTRDYVETYQILKNINNDMQSISFLYEYDWRWNLCNRPLFKNTIEAYKKAIGFVDNKKTIKIQSFSKTVQKKALKLLISLYKACRKDGEKKLCLNIESIINNNFELLEDQDKKEFYYQQSLTALFNLEYSKFIQFISCWNLKPSDYEWNIKKAGLLAESGYELNAVEILKKSLNSLRNKLEKNKDNFELLFFENLINWQLIWICNSKRFDKDFPKNIINEDELRNRNKFLSAQISDILEILNSYSKDIYSNKLKKLEKKEIDYVTTQNITIGSEEAPFASFIYINIFERIGYPYKINNSTFNDSNVFSFAVNNILPYQPDWALILIIRSYNETNVEENIGYEEIKMFSTNGISSFIETMLQSFTELQEDLSKGTDFAAKDFCNRLIKTYPELLSRLCSKVNSKTKEQLLAFLITIIKKNLICRMPSIEKFIKRFTNTLTFDDKEKLINEIIKSKAPNYRPIDTTRNLNPLSLLYPKTETELKSHHIKLNQTAITTLLKKYVSEKDQYLKKWYLTSLVTISLWNGFDKINYESFAQILWSSDLDEYGLPILDGFYKSIILQLAHPATIDVEKKYQKMIDEIKIPIISKQGIITYPIDFTWYDKICRPKNSKLFSLNFWENILKMIEEQWNFDSKYLEENDEPFNSYKINARDNFRYSSLILKRMIIDNYKELNDSTSEMFKYKERIIKQINLFYDSGINCLESFTSILLIENNKKQTILNLLNQKLASAQRDEVVEVLNSITLLLKLECITLEDKSELIDLIINAVYWLARGDLEDCISACSYVIILKKDLINIEQITKLCIALTNIRKMLNEEEKTVDIKTIKIKSSAAFLAKCINDFLIDLNMPVPEEIEKWKNIAFDENEFVEIRNQWEEII